MEEYYKLLDLTFKINHYYEYFARFAKDFLCPPSEDYIYIESSKIDATNWKNKHPDPIDYPLAYIETLSIQSKLADLIASLNSFIFHGSSIYLDNINNGYIFTAPSGTGKSTHTRLLKEMFFVN